MDAWIGVLARAVGAVILYVARPVSRSALGVRSIVGWEWLGAVVLKFWEFGPGLLGRSGGVRDIGFRAALLEVDGAQVAVVGSPEAEWRPPVAAGRDRAGVKVRGGTRGSAPRARFHSDRWGRADQRTATVVELVETCYERPVDDRDKLGRGR